jgi:glycosyltransferase involved in cell wall biosynthesis
MLSGTFNNFYDRRLTEYVMQTLADQGYETKWCRPRESLDSLLSVTNLEVLEVKHQEMPAQIALASIGIAICRDDVGVSLKGVMPTKVAEFLATGRPVIISRGMGDLDQFITSYRAGLLIDRETTKKDIIAAIENLLRDPETPRRCRKLAEDKFSMDKAVRGYLETYQALIAKAS